MSSSSSSGSDNSCYAEELLQIGTRCQELRKQKEMLTDSQSQSFDLIRRLEIHVKNLSEGRAGDGKHINQLERELQNCSQEIDYLQEQLNARNEELYSLGEHVHSLELKLAYTESLEEKVASLSEELNSSNSERLILMQELEKREMDLQHSSSCIEKLEESMSSVSLEYQCEIESMKLLAALEHGSIGAEENQKETEHKSYIQDLQLQIQNAEKVAEFLNKENEELRKKLEASDQNARVFVEKIGEQYEELLDSHETHVDIQPLSSDSEEDISNCRDSLGPTLSKLAFVGTVVKQYKDKVDKMSCQMVEYEHVVKQLKHELREEKLKAKDEAEDLAQEMAELRYEVTNLLEEERKRRAWIEQVSLKRIAELEAQIQRERRKTSSPVRLLDES